MRRVLRERDQLKEATSEMETELIQVHMGVWGGLCVSEIVYTVHVHVHMGIWGVLCVSEIVYTVHVHVHMGIWGGLCVSEIVYTVHVHMGVWGGLCVSEIVYTVHVFVTFYRFRVMPNLWPMIETTSNSSMSKSASMY